MKQRVNLKKIGSRIKQLRLPQTQTEFAQLIGCDQGYVSQVERGSTKPSLWFLNHLVQITRCSLDWIIYGKGKKSVRRNVKTNRQRRPPRSGRSRRGRRR
jgi:transcriptional regulator with XRE-family HTH domain